MESIVQAVEGAITKAETHVEAEAKAGSLVVEESVGRVKACGAHIYACVRCHLTKAEAEGKHAITQAEKDADEDAETVRGAFSRFVHRVWAAI